MQEADLCSKRQFVKITQDEHPKKVELIHVTFSKMTGCTIELALERV
jgi:hypothetical protein